MDLEHEIKHGFDLTEAAEQCYRYAPELDMWNEFDAAHIAARHGAKLYVKAGGQLFVRMNSRLEVGANSRIFIYPGGRLFALGRFSLWNDCYIQVKPGGTLILGNGFMNDHACIECGSYIHIGDAIMSHFSYITDTDAHKIFDASGEQLNPDEPVIFDGHVWICHGATVLKGVHIGHGSIVGAGSVVCHDVPAGALAAGNPAQVIREGISWKA